jgi:hypothetical protein
MVQPINYLQNVQDPFAQAVQGLQLGTGIANIYAQREADEQKRVQQALAQAEQQRYQTGINTFFTTAPAERKYEDLERLFVGANKQQFDALQAVGKTMTDEKLATSKRFTGQVLSALESNPESAKQLIRKYAEAETDPMQKTAWQDTLKLAEISPDQAIRSVELMGGAAFGKDWYEGISNVRKSRREEAQAPSVLAEAVAKAKKAVAEAEDTPSRLAAEQELRVAQAAQQRALTAASVGGEARAVALAPSVLLEAVAKADAAVADAKKKVAEAADTPARLEAEQGLRVAQTEQQRALTAASVGGEARAVAKAPGELIEANAKADRAVADAKTAQATATNAPEKAAADAALTRAQADKAKVVAEFARADAVLEAQGKAATIKKTEADILINKENARIAALNAAIARETNTLKRQELEQKIKDAQATRDAAAREQTATFNSQIADIDNFLNTAERIKQTPIKIIESATGPISSRLPTTNQDVSDFESLVETLGSQVFIAQIPKIKGTGALSEKEGDKLQASVQNLSLKQSPARLIENVNEAVRLMGKARNNLSVRAGLPALPLDVPASTEVTVTLPNGATMKFPNQAGADAFKRAAGIR